MNSQHKNLAGGRWAQMSLLEQMANIGSEISRALKWQENNNQAYCQKAVDRSLELIDLTLASISVPSHYKEISRLREAVVDYFLDKNQFASSPELWRKYFDHFNYALRKNH